MATISATTFFGGKVPPPPAPTPAPAHPLDGYGVSDQIKSAFSAAVEGGKAGYSQAVNARNPLELLEGSAKLAASPFNALAAPLAPIIKPTIGAATNYAADKISDIPAVQKFATGKGGAIASRVAEDVGNLATIAGGVAGTEAGIKGAGIAARTTGQGLREGVDVAGKGLTATGQKIQQSVIRPTARDVKDGFKIANVQKYDVGGSLPETIAKSHARLNELSTQLAEKLKGSNSAVNLNHTISQTIENLALNKARSFGDNGAVDRVIEQLKSEVEHVAGKNGLVDLVEATNVKRGAGTKGAWSFNRPEADASAIEKVYTEFYDVLKKQIEQAAPEGVKQLNRQLSDLIPIQNAALRRLPVAERNNAISLTDSIGLLSSVFDPKALLVLGATKAAKSGRVGNALTKAGQALQLKTGEARPVGTYFKNNPPSVGLAIKKVGDTASNVSPETVARNVDSADLALIKNYLDKPADISAYTKAQPMFEAMGISKLSDADQVRFLKEVLDQAKKQGRDDKGRFTSKKP